MIISGDIEKGMDDVQTILVAEKQVVFTFNPKDMPLILLSTFYVFNLHYTEGCINFYTALEVMLLKQRLSQNSRKTRLTAFLKRLEHVT